MGNDEKEHKVESNQLSTGHICFAGDYEYFKEGAGDVWRTEIANRINHVTNQRVGAKFFCTMGLWTSTSSGFIRPDMQNVEHVLGTPVGIRLNKLDGVPAREKATAEAVNIVRCDNCQKNLIDREIIPLVDVVGLGSRLDPGSIVPFGECRICGALVY